MFQFLVQKIRSKKWMMICMLTGNILFVSVLCCMTMYSEAILQRMINQKMNTYLEEQNEYPLMLTVSDSLTVVSATRHNGDLFEQMETMVHDTAGRDDIEIEEMVTHYNITAKSEPDIRRNGQKLSMTLQIGFLSNMEEHINIIMGTEGTGYGADHILSVMVSEQMLASQKLILGEVITVKNLTDQDGNPMKVRIDGIFEAAESDREYWVNTPNSYDTMMFISEELFRDLFVDFEKPLYPIRGSWYLLFDYSNLTTEDCNSLIHLTDAYTSITQQETSVSMTENYTVRLQEFLQEENKTSASLWVLQVPILVLLAAFIMMVSKQMLMLEQTEIAVLKSRGAGRKQILLIYTGQSLIIGTVACLIGVFLGALLCQVLGSANAFMEFVARDALIIDFFSIKLLLTCLAAVGIAVIATVLPVIRHSDVSIVIHRHKKGKKHTTPFWQRYGLDFIVLAAAGYGLYVFRGREEELMQRVIEGKSIDPLLYFSSSLFMVGAGLVVIRLINLLIRAIFKLGRRLWSPALYASFTRVSRTRNEQNFIVVFLILTIALGIFNAQTARTINANDENNIFYQVGADVVLQEQWMDNSQIVESDTTGITALTYQEPDFDQYMAIEGVVGATKVYKGSASIEYIGGSYDGVELMGIDIKEFGETAWFTEDLLDTHWYHYLNAMAESPYGILVSASFKDELGYQLGDTLYYTVEGYQTRGIICGFIDYWPGFRQTVEVDGWENETFEINNYLIVTHRAQLQSLIGLRPYQVFLKTNGNTENIYEYLQQNEITVSAFTDATMILVEHKNDPILQGTNGMLTVGFITILLVCIIGFLLYWILSIHSRSLQFGVFRAMGMTMREIMSMLINEQIFITGLSAVAGVFVGLTASKLYIPLIQIAYAKEDNLLPLRIVNEPADTYHILIVVSVMIISCMVILGTLIARTGIAQAVKLGED